MSMDVNGGSEIINQATFTQAGPLFFGFHGDFLLSKLPDPSLGRKKRSQIQEAMRNGDRVEAAWRSKRYAWDL